MSASVTLALMTMACQATHVVYVHDTVLGLDLAPAAEGSARFTFGFDRQVYAIVPCFDEPTQPDASGKSTGSIEAASVAAFSRVHTSGVDDIEFHHVIATGAPAQEIAKDAAVLEQLRRSVVDPAFDREPARSAGGSTETPNGER